METLLEWQNIIFIVPLCFAGCLIIGGLHGFGHEVGHDVSHDVHHGHHGHDDEHSVLSMLGIGHVPIILALTMMNLVFGVTGLISNEVLRGVPYSGYLSLVAAGLVSLLGTGRVAKRVGKLMPMTTSSNSRKSDLVGQVGTTMFAVFPNGITYLQVNDFEGNLMQVQGLLPEGRADKGERLVLVSFDETNDRFIVQKEVVKKES